MKFLPMILMFALFGLNIPVALSLIISGMVYFVFLNHDIPMDMLIQSMVASTESFPMLAIPFFITAGAIMTYAGISKNLLDFAEVLTGHMTGGLGQVNVILSAFMGGISGSPSADTAFQAKLLVPEMVRKGYSKGFSGAITACSSVITPIIPPGIVLIIYAFVANQSIGDMFMAGYIPGIIITIALMVTVHIISNKRGYLPSREKKASVAEVLTQAKKSFWALAIPFGIILGLRFGLFTPTECGAITVLYSIIVGIFVYKQLKLQHIPRILCESVISTAAVMFIISSAALFARYLSWERIPQTISDFVIGLTNNPYMFLLLVNVFLLILGMFFDGAAAIIILTPLLAPVALKLGINPIHFGIIVCINITIGGCTPPFGIMMFTACSIIKLKVSEYIREAAPLILTLVIVLGLVTYIPQISLFLVNITK